MKTIAVTIPKQRPWRTRTVVLCFWRLPERCVDVSMTHPLLVPIFGAPDVPRVADVPISDLN
jgi:hypothetical protein